MRIVGVDGEMHVKLPDGSTMPYGQFRYLRAAHLSCCEECSTKRLVRSAWRMSQCDESNTAVDWPG